MTAFYVIAGLCLAAPIISETDTWYKSKHTKKSLSNRKLPND